MNESRLKSSLLTSSSNNARMQTPSILLTSSATTNVSSSLTKGLNSSLLSVHSSAMSNSSLLLTNTAKLLQTSSLVSNKQLGQKDIEESKKKKIDADLSTENKKPKLLADASIRTDLLITTKSPLQTSSFLTLKSDLKSSHQTKSMTLSLNSNILKLNSTSLLTANESIMSAKKSTEASKIVVTTKRQHSDEKENVYDTEDFDLSLPETIKVLIESQMDRFDSATKRQAKRLKAANKLESKTSILDPMSPKNLILNQKTELLAAKNALINAVSASLIREPNFKSAQDTTRKTILQLAERVTLSGDPQFLLKLALYTRRELNIRVTANFLISLASYLDACRPYLQRYFKHAILLPSDWIDVAEQYQLFTDKRINFGSLPSALRKSMSEKFVDFDKYQLAKYNKEKSRLAKNNQLRDVKHVKARINPSTMKGDGEMETDVVEGEKLTEEKYIKILRRGLAINDRIYFEIVVKDACKSLKIDVLRREESAASDTKPNFSSRRAPRLTEKKKENADTIAVRVRVDYENKQIVQKSFIKEWSKRGDIVRRPNGFDFDRSFDSVYMFVDVKSSEFVFGVIKKTNGNHDQEVVLSRYPHSKHKIPLNNLNCLRISGANIKLKDLAVRSQEIVHMDSQPEEGNELKKRSYTLKQLIRQLHISQPVDNVMSLIGKKYPETFEDFMKLKLPGLFESERAGKRMKLPTPETWETQISLKGNKAQVWEQLIDNKKLPYMAMLRNLRNMIKCGISERHHQWVIKKLQDEGAVIYSKQFPFRFFTANSVLDELQEEFNEYIKWSQSPDAAQAASSTTTTRRPIRGKKMSKKAETQRFKDMNYDPELLKRYKTALDNALKVATTFNISPIKGSTLILLNLGIRTGDVSRVGKSLGKRVTSVAEIAALLALMFKYACENCKLVAFSAGLTYENFQLDDSTILDNMKSLVDLKNMTPSGSTDYVNYPKRVLGDILERKELFDNMVVLSDGLGDHVEYQRDFLRKYRTLINEKFLFVNVNLGSDECKIVPDEIFDHENDIAIAGFSDAILKFVAARGNQAQLVHVENIDKAYEIVTNQNTKLNIKDINKSIESELTLIERPSALPKCFVPISEWRTLKVFISSTFRDMHSERDVLAKTVFPILRSQLAKFSINLYDIDLRWGITTDQVDNNQTLELCLSQVLACDYFLAILGERYGVVIDNYSTKRKINNLEWLQTYPRGASITELEIETKLRRINETRDQKLNNTFFYFRDHESFINEVPKDIRAEHFEENLNENRTKLSALKNRVKSDAYEIMDNYKCKWSGLDSNGRATLSGLDAFAVRAFNNLYNSIIKDNQDRVTFAELDENVHQNGLTDVYIKSAALDFVGRENALRAFENIMNETKYESVFSYSSDAIKEHARSKNSILNIVLLNGEAGCGKTAFLAKYLTLNSCSGGLVEGAFVHIVGAYPNSEFTTLMLKRLVITVNRFFNLGLNETQLHESNDAKIFQNALSSIIQQLDSKITERKFYIIIDGVDQLLDDNGAPDHSFGWLPKQLSPKIVFIFTARSSSPTKTALGKLASSSNSNPPKIKLSTFDLEPFGILDKSEFVRHQLGKFNKFLDENPFNNQMKLLTGKRESNDPLFLTLACEELRLHGHFETLSGKIKELPVKLNKLVDFVLDRIEQDFGEAFFNSALMFVCCSRDGLEETELRDLLGLYFAILNSKSGIIQHLNSCDKNLVQELDKVTFKKVLAQSKMFISTDKFLSFIESITRTFLRARNAFDQTLAIKKNIIIENALRTRLIAGNEDQINVKKPSVKLINRIMALYYWSQANPSLDSNWKSSSVTSARSLTYLPYHLAISGLRSDAMSLVSNLLFINLKCELGIVGELADDFNLHEVSIEKNLLAAKNLGSNVFAKKSINSSRPKSTSMQSSNEDQTILNFAAYKSFIMSNFHLIVNNPRILFQQALNEPDTSVVAIDVRNLLRNNDISKNACNILEWVTKTNEQNQVALLKMTPTRITEFDDSVSCATLSSDGLLVACGTENCEIKIFNVATSKFVRKLQGHAGRINSLVFANAKTLCSASSDGLACLWNVDEGFRIRVLNKHNDHVVSSVCVEKSGKTLVTVAWDCTAKIWNVAEGNVQGELKHPKPVNCVAFNPDFSQVATGCWDACIRIFNYVERSRKAVLRGHKSSVRSISFSRDGIYIGSASIDGDVKLWNARNGSQVAQLRGHSLPVNSLSFSPKNQFLITGSSDRTVKIWPGSVGKLLRIVNNQAEKEIEKRSVSNKDPISSVCFDQSREGELFAAGTHSGYVRLYELCGGVLKCDIRAHQARIRRLRFVPNGSVNDNRTIYIFTASDDGKSKLLCANADLTRITILAELASSDAPSPLTSLDVNSQNLIIAGSEDCTVYVFSDVIENYNSLHQNDMSSGKVNNWRPKLCLNAHKSAITSCVFNEIGDKFASASKDATVIVWEYSYSSETASQLFVINRAHEDWITDMAWSPTADFILTASNDLTLKIWSAFDGKEKSRLVGHTSTISSCAFRYGCAVSTCWDGTVKIWSHRGHEITTLYGHKDKVNSCDLYVKIRKTFQLELEKAKQNKDDDDDQPMELGTLWSDRVDNEAFKQKKKAVESSRNSFDIQDVLLVTASEDGTVRVWKPTESNYLASMDIHNGGVNSVHLSEQNMVASASDDRSVALTSLGTFFEHHESLIDSERAVRGHMSEITCLSASGENCGDLILSGSLDGNIFIWRLESNLNALDFELEFRAHEQFCSSVCVIGENFNAAKGIRTVRFATCGKSDNIKIWELREHQQQLLQQSEKRSKPSIQLVQNLQRNRQNGKFVFVGKMKMPNGEEKLVGVQQMSELFFISFFNNIHGSLNHAVGGCSILCKSSVFSKIELNGSKLYIALVHDEILEINLIECVKKLWLITSEYKETDKLVLTRLKSAATRNDLGKVALCNETWYTALESPATNNERIRVGDWHGNVYNTKQIDGGLELVRNISSSRITAIRAIKREAMTSDDERIVCSDQDGVLRIFCENFREQLGMFKNTCEITQLLALVGKNRESIGIVVGDKSGNVNLFKWYD